MEPEPASFRIRHGIRVFVRENPASAGEGELQLVPVVYRILGRYDRGYFRYGEVPDAYQLVIHLLLLRLQLHGIGKRLPFAAAACPEMAAERLKPVL